MKPAPRLTIRPMTDLSPVSDHDRVERILSDFAHDMAAFAAVILAVGGTAVLLLAMH